MRRLSLPFFFPPYFFPPFFPSFFFPFSFSFFLDLFYLFKYLNQGSTKDVSSVVGAPRRCGVLTTQGLIAGIGSGHQLGREHASTNSPEWGGDSSLVKTEPLQIVLLLLLFQTHLKVCVRAQHLNPACS